MQDILPILKQFKRLKTLCLLDPGQLGITIEAVAGSRYVSAWEETQTLLHKHVARYTFAHCDFLETLWVGSTANFLRKWTNGVGRTYVEGPKRMCPSRIMPSF
jgi:hypothetical protein